MSIQFAINVLSHSPAYCSADESSRVLAAFVVDGVAERTGGLLPEPSPRRNVIAFYPRPTEARRRSNPVVFEFIRKTDVSLTIGLAPPPSFFIQLGFRRLLVRGRPPFSRARGRDLNDVEELIEMVCAALRY